MVYINTTDLDLGDWITLRNVLNKDEQWQVISIPKDSEMRGSLMSCFVRRGKIEKKVHFNKK